MVNKIVRCCHSWLRQWGRDGQRFASFSELSCEFLFCRSGSPLTFGGLTERWRWWPVEYLFGEPVSRYINRLYKWIRFAYYRKYIHRFVDCCWVAEISAIRLFDNRLIVMVWSGWIGGMDTCYARTSEWTGSMDGRSFSARDDVNSCSWDVTCEIALKVPAVGWLVNILSVSVCGRERYSHLLMLF